MIPYIFVDSAQSLNIRLNIGMTGCGKSSLLAYQLGRIRAANRKRKFDRILLVDPSRDDFHFSKFGRTAETAKEASGILGATLSKFHLRIHTRSIEVFDYLCWEAHRHGDLFLIVDEIQNFQPTKAGAVMQPENFNKLVTESRHVRVRILGTAQRPTQIHNNLLNLAQEVNIFRTEDLQLVKQKLRTPENCQTALNLETLTFFSCKDGKPELCVVPKN